MFIILWKQAPIPSESPQPTPQSYKDRRCPVLGCFREHVLRVVLRKNFVTKSDD